MMGNKVNCAHHCYDNGCLGNCLIKRLRENYALPQGPDKITRGTGCCHSDESAEGRTEKQMEGGAVKIQQDSILLILILFNVKHCRLKKIPTGTYVIIFHSFSLIKYEILSHFLW